jgi:hypothetical protein
MIKDITCLFGATPDTSPKVGFKFLVTLFLLVTIHTNK